MNEKSMRNKQDPDVTLPCSITFVTLFGLENQILSLVSLPYSISIG